MSADQINNEVKILEKEINYHFKKVVIPKQSHTTNVEIVTEKNMNSEFVDVDGVLTNVKGIAVGTVSADCQAILLYDKKKKVVGSIHSGWRGTLNGIIIEAINKMKEYYHSDVDDICVTICPSILQCCFEVEDDVYKPFLDKYGDKYIKKGDIINGKRKYYVDTLSINVDLLHEMGVMNVNAVDKCICCGSKTFHSYRRDGKDTGRNIGLIGLIDKNE